MARRRPWCPAPRAWHGIATCRGRALSPLRIQAKIIFPELDVGEPWREPGLGRADALAVWGKVRAERQKLEVAPGGCLAMDAIAGVRFAFFQETTA